MGERQADIAPDLNRRQDNIGRLLLLAYRRFERIASQELAARGYTDLRLPHFQVLPHMDAQGARMIDIAEKMNLTRQAIGQIASELEDKGYLLRIPDPDDGRAKNLALTGKGQELLVILPDVVIAAEKQIADLIGENLIAQLKSSLSTIAE